MGKKKHKQKKREKKRAMSPSMTHNWLYIFFILGEGGETEGNNMRKIMKELCPNTTHRERNTTLQHEGQQSQKELTNESTKLELTLRQVMTKV